MDHALLLPATAPDRRTLVRLLFAGATGVALAEAGIPMIAADSFRGPDVEIRELHKTLGILAGRYDELGPRRVGVALKGAETTLMQVFGARPSAVQEREAKVLYGRLMTMTACAESGVGQFVRAERAGKLGARMALSVGDRETACRAAQEVSFAANMTGSPRTAVMEARRAQSYSLTSTGPRAVSARLTEAQGIAAMPTGDPDKVLDIVTTAEAAHAKLAPDRWGTPGATQSGGSPNTLHPGDLKSHAASVFIKLGRYDEAIPRLNEASDLLTGTGGLEQAYVWLLHARAFLGLGDVDTALDFAALAVTSAERRPAEWVARIVGELDDASKATHPAGAFAELVERTRDWRLGTA